MILSNPPYIPTPEIPSLEPEIRMYEPEIALDGGPDGLDPSGHDFFSRPAAGQKRTAAC